MQVLLICVLISIIIVMTMNAFIPLKGLVKDIEEITSHSEVDCIHKSFEELTKDQIIIMDGEGHILSSNIQE